MRLQHQAPAAAQSGLTLIEVLVTVVVLLIGLLGMAVLMARGQKAEAESYQRAQALLLLQDMVARINGNRSVAECYITSAFPTPFMGTGSSAVPACGVGTPAAYTLANQDLIEWSDLLTGATETLAGNSVGTMKDARGCVTVDDPINNDRLYTVSVAWQGLTTTAAPDAARTCGLNLYGDERLRRVVSVPVQIADLN